MNAIELIRTPLLAVPSDGGTVYVKNETVQITGAFKFRGVRAKLLQDPGRGPVCTASTGNHGAAVAAVAAMLGRPSVVFVPADTPEVKTNRIELAGAELMLFDGDYTSCADAAQEWAALNSATYIPSFDDVMIVAGHTGVAREILQDLPRDPDYAWVPVGGGGLLTASLLTFAAHTHVIGVELEAADAMRQSLAARRRVVVDVPRGIAEGLCVREVGTLPFRVASLARAQVVTVSVQQLEDAVRRLWNTAGIRAELAGAAAFAAALAYRSQLPGTHVAIASGGNIDAELFDRIIGARKAAA